MVASPPKSVAVKVLVLIVAVTVPALLLRQALAKDVPKSLGAESANSAYVQTDTEEGVTVLATYLPNESKAGEIAFSIELTSTGPDLTNYDMNGHVVLANGDITPVATKSTVYGTRSKNKVTARMVFERTSDTHYHLLVQDLAGVGERVLHFYF